MDSMNEQEPPPPRAERFGRLLAEQHKRSAALGLDKMTPDEIDAEITQVRAMADGDGQGQVLSSGGGDKGHGGEGVGGESIGV